MTARGLSNNKSPFCKNAIESIDTACPERLSFFVADVGVFLANRFLAVDTPGPDVKHYWWGAIKSVIMVSRAISINGSVALKKWGVAGQWHPPPRGVELERARSGERDETERDTRLTSGVKSSHLNHKKNSIDRARLCKLPPDQMGRGPSPSWGEGENKYFYTFISDLHENSSRLQRRGTSLRM